jgi:hypothetical protein
MNRSTKKTCGRIGIAIVAGGLLSACGTSGLLPASDTQSSDDAVAASIRTHQEFEQYWAQQRHEQPVKPTPAESYEPAPVVAQEEPAAPVEVYQDDSWTEPSWEPEEAVVSGPKPSKKNAKAVVTWWEYRDGASGSRNYSKLSGGSSFPTGKSAGFGSRYVISPYNGQYVDVNGLGSGTLVSDPSYEVADRKYFLVP